MASPALAPPPAAPPAPGRGATPAALAALGAVALTQALIINNGGYDPVAVPLLLLAVAGGAAALVAGRWPALERGGEGPVGALLGVGLLAAFMEQAALKPGPHGAFAWPQTVPFLLGLAAAGFLAGSALGPRPWLRRAHVPALLALHLALGAWIVVHAPTPAIDVHAFHVESLRALLAGRDPYAMTMPDIYGDGRFYPPGLVVGGRVQQGYPYPPLLLLLALPGHLLLGDHRYGELVALTASGALIAWARPGRLATLAATLFLFMPRGFYLLENGYTEPYVVLFLSAVLFCAVRGGRLWVAALGLFLAAKQYTPFLAPGLALLVPRPVRWRPLLAGLAAAAALAAAVTLPLALWHPRAFLHSMLVPGASLRTDALSFGAAWFHATGQRSPGWLGFLAAAGVAAWALVRGPRGPAGAAAAVAVLAFAFFGLGQQAFLNHYLVPLCSLCWAAALAEPGAARREGGFSTESTR